MEKEHRQGEETTEGAIVLQNRCLCYVMLCYAMFIEQKSEPGRKRSAATQNLREKVQNDSLGLGNAARAEILEGDVWGALKIEHYVLRA